MAAGIVATPAAVAAVERLTAERGPLMFFLSGGCCDGSSPICLPRGELVVGPNDLLLGEVAGAPFWIDREQYERWNRPALELGVAEGPGAAEFSLEGLAGIRFTTATRRAA